MSSQLVSGSSSGAITSVDIVLLGFELIARRGAEVVDVISSDTCDHSKVFELALNISGEVVGYIKKVNDLGVFILTGAGWNALMAIKLKRGFHTIPEDELARGYLKGAIQTLRVIKAGTLLIPNPVMKKGAQASIDASAHALTAYRGMIAEEPAQDSPNSWKDKAHQVAVVTLSTLSMIGSLYVIAASAGLVEEDDRDYQVAQKTALASMALNIGYGVLQSLGVFSRRD